MIWGVFDAMLWCRAMQAASVFNLPRRVTMESAREKAIRLLIDLFSQPPAANPAYIEEIVDALIDAARAPNSAHTRAVADKLHDPRP